MHSRLACVVAATVLAVVACKSTPPATRTTAEPASGILVRASVTATDSAFRAFVPTLPAVDSGGECQVRRTSGSGATTVTAFFPSMGASRNTVSLTFDSVGHLVRYNDTRSVAAGPMRIDIPAGSTPAQRDSAIGAIARTRPTTNIALNWPEDQATLSNFNGGQPQFMTGIVRSVENIERLGPPTARIVRVRKLCGV